MDDILKKLNIVELIGAIQSKVESKTGLPCYDDARNAVSPFYMAEFVGKSDASSKTMYCENYAVLLHIISSPSAGNTENYNMITGLEEALTEDIELPDDYVVIAQTETGVNARQIDETGERHTTILYEFKICYGYKIK